MTNTKSIQTLTTEQTKFLAKHGFKAEHNGIFGLKFIKAGEANGMPGEGTVPATWYIYQETVDGGWNVLLESKYGCYDRARKTSLKHAFECVIR